MTLGTRGVTLGVAWRLCAVGVRVCTPPGPVGTGSESGTTMEGVAMWPRNAREILRFAQE